MPRETGDKTNHDRSGVAPARTGTENFPGPSGKSKTPHPFWAGPHVQTLLGDTPDRRHPEETSRGDTPRIHREETSRGGIAPGRLRIFRVPRETGDKTKHDRPGVAPARPGPENFPVSRGKSRNPHPFWEAPHVQPFLGDTPARRHPEEPSRGDTPRRHLEETS